MRKQSPVTILLVEDNPGDVRLTREAFRGDPGVKDIHHVGDGVEAMDFLFHKNGYASAPRPDLVLLDLNLPRMKGQEVLAKMRAEESLRNIPVVALTTSEAREDIQSCYALGVNAYIVKPVEFDRFIDTVRSFREFWLTTARLPD